MGINVRQIALALILGGVLAASACSGSRGRQIASSSTPVPVGQVTTTSAPIPVPQAAFVIDRASGSAPLTVQFTNQSRDAGGFIWDFGDGTTSNERSPVHIYTKAGQWTVRLIAADLDRSRDLSDVDTSTAITCDPGSLAKLALEPVDASLEVGNTLRFKTLAEDVYGNTITDLSSSWAISVEAGRITPDGLLEVGTRAGFYPAAVKLSASYGAASLVTTANLTVLAGPIASAKISPSGTSIFTGDSVTLQLEAADRFGNQATPTSVLWNVDPTRGSITGGQASATFRAGRQAGTVLLSVEARDSRGAAVNTIPLTVQQGYCNTSRTKAQWKAQWWALNPDGSRGASLGASTFSGVINENWQRGEIFGGRSDLIRLEAKMEFVLRRQGPVRFTLGADDGYRLHLDGKPIIETFSEASHFNVSGDTVSWTNSWSNHGYRETSSVRILEPGVYSLDLDYYDWTDIAQLKFSMDGDALEWDEIVQCFGGFVQPLPFRFALYPYAESSSAIAERFGFSTNAIRLAKLAGAPVYFVERQTGSHRKVVVLQGIDSYSGCGDIAGVTLRSDSPSARADALYGGLHAYVWAARQDVSEIDRKDIVIFSYADQYQLCGSSNVPYTSANLPIDSPVVANYSQSATCQGVVQAAGRLRSLIQRLVQQDPEVKIDLVGHSLGGMTLAYFAIMESEGSIMSRIGRMVTIDSPLTGTNDQNPFSACSTASASWIDISGSSQVVPQIVRIPSSSVSGRFYSINNSPVGESNKLIGMSNPAVYVECGASGGAARGSVVGGYLGTTLFGPLGLLIGAIFGSDVGSKVAGHSCAWSDATSILTIAEMLGG